MDFQSMDFERMKFFVGGIDLFSGTYPITIGREVENENQIEYVESFIIRNCEPGQMIKPAAHISHQQAQGLIDSLWMSGLRPTNVKYNTELVTTLRETKKHLEVQNEKMINYLVSKK